MLLPVVWLLLSSVKQGDRVLTDEPEWLPWTVRHAIRHEGRDVPVTLFDETRRDDLGVVRVLPRDRDPEDPFRWPVGELSVTDWAVHTVEVDGRRIPVSVTPTPGGTVRCVLRGRHATRTVGPGEVRQEVRESFYVEAFGRPFPIARGQDGTWRILPGPPFAVAAARLDDGRLTFPFGARAAVRVTREIPKRASPSSRSRSSRS